MLSICLGTVFRCATFAQTPNCEFSQTTYDSDIKFQNRNGPTFVRLMGIRYVDLRRAERGLSCSGVPLVGFDGLRYQRVAEADDPGIYYFVPALARSFDIPLERAIDLTLVGTIIVGSSIGLVGYLRTSKTIPGRRIGIIGFLLLSLVELIGGDVYIMNAAPAVAFVPWIIYFASKKRLTLGAFGVFALAGCASQVATFFRAHAGIALLLFALISLAGLYQMKPLDRALLATVLILGCVSVQLFCRDLYVQRRTFLGEKDA